MKRALGLTLLLAFLLTACGSKNTESTKAHEQAGTQYADLLSITPEDGYTRVDVRTEKGGRPVATYLLVPRESE